MIWSAIWMTAGWMLAGISGCSGGKPADPEDSGGDTTDSAGDSGDSGTPTFTLSAPDLLSSEGYPESDRCAWRLPEPFSCDGPSPALVWSGVPAGAASLVLILDDPDARDFPHWAVLNLPPDSAGLAAGASQRGQESALPEGAEELENGGGWVGYFGSCPPITHVYRWRLWALSGTATAPQGSAAEAFADLAAQAELQSLGRADLCHIYGP